MSDASAGLRGRRLVVALDGPGSSGKSSVGAAAALRVGYGFCDTGLLYRAVTWLALDLGLRLDDGPALAAAAERVELSADPVGRLDRVVVDGRDVSADVHSRSVDARVSLVARLPEVRAALLERQRRIARSGGVIMAGRDIGTVVLPDADLKLYLEASVEERARRRAVQRGHPPDGPEAAAILADLRIRDKVDSTRAAAPLRIPDEALIINTDGIGFADTVDMVVAAIQDAEAEAPAAAAPPAEPRAEGPPAESAAPAEKAKPAEESPPNDAAPATEAANPERAPAPGGRAAAARSLPDDASPFIRLTDLTGRTIVRALTRVRVEGLEHARGLTGPVIVASNHISNADGVLVASWITPAIGRRIYLLGKQEALEWPLLGLGLRLNAVLGFRLGAADLEAFRAAKHVLDEGHVLGIFPEGTRSPTAALQEAKDGLAILALRTGATILPVGVANTDRFWPRGGRPRFGGWVGLRVGRPFTLGEVTRGLSRRQAQAAATAEIMGRIAGLLPPRHRGAYAGRVVEDIPDGWLAGASPPPPAGER